MDATILKWIIYSNQRYTLSTAVCITRGVAVQGYFGLYILAYAKGR